MSQPILSILKNQDLRKIQEDPLGKQARQLDKAYPGAHAETETAAVLRPCNGSDSRQLWGGNYGSCPVPRTSLSDIRAGIPPIISEQVLPTGRQLRRLLPLGCASHPDGPQRREHDALPQRAVPARQR